MDGMGETRWMNKRRRREIGSLFNLLIDWLVGLFVD